LLTKYIKGVLWGAAVRLSYTGWSKSRCAPHDYNTLGSICLAADRQSQGDTRLTPTPSVIPNSNYVIMVTD
jgi:hypothetical protein